MNLATIITLFRLLLTTLILLLVYYGSYAGSDAAYVGAIALFAFAVFTDFLDGRVARKLGQVTTLGTILDALVDKILIHSVLFSLLALNVLTPLVVFPMFIRDMFVDGFRNKLFGISVFWGANIWGKAKFMLQSFAIGFGLLYCVYKTDVAFQWIAEISLAAAILVSLPGLWGSIRTVMEAASAQDGGKGSVHLTKPIKKT